MCEKAIFFYMERFYEILNLNEPTEIFGQVDHKMEILAKCTRARRGVFDGT